MLMSLVAFNSKSLNLKCYGKVVLTQWNKIFAAVCPLFTAEFCGRFIDTKALLPYFSLEIPAKKFCYVEVRGVVTVRVHLISLGSEGLTAVFGRPALLHDLPSFFFFLREHKEEVRVTGGEMKNNSCNNHALIKKQTCFSEILTLMIRMDSIPLISMRQLMMTGLLAVIMSSRAGYSGWYAFLQTPKQKNENAASKFVKNVAKKEKLNKSQKLQLLTFHECCRLFQRKDWRWSVACCLSDNSVTWAPEGPPRPCSCHSRKPSWSSADNTPQLQLMRDPSKWCTRLRANTDHQLKYLHFKWIYCFAETLFISIGMPTFVKKHTQNNHLNAAKSKITCIADFKRIVGHLIPLLIKWHFYKW